MKTQRINWLEGSVRFLPWVTACFFFMVPGGYRVETIDGWSDFYELDRWFAGLFGWVVVRLWLKYRDRNLDWKEMVLVWGLLIGLLVSSQWVTGLVESRWR